MIQNRIQPWYLIAIVLVLAFTRLIPHPPNAVPIAAMALFAGAYFSNRVLAFIVPISAMFISDLLLGFHSTVWYVYAGIAITVLVGNVIQQLSVVRVSIATIVASIIFYLVTNFGAWLHHGMYPQNVNGLVQAYIAGLPFLRNALIANLIFSYLLFYGLNGFLPVQSLPKRSS